MLLKTFFPFAMESPVQINKFVFILNCYTGLPIMDGLHAIDNVYKLALVINHVVLITNRNTILLAGKRVIGSYANAALVLSNESFLHNITQNMCKTP